MVNKRGPAGAQQERALVAGQPVDAVPGSIAVDQPALVGEPPACRMAGTDRSVPADRCSGDGAATLPVSWDQGTRPGTPTGATGAVRARLSRYRLMTSD